MILFWLVPSAFYNEHAVFIYYFVCLFFVFCLLLVPTKPPANVKVVSSTLSSIKVSWGQIPKNDRNGVILGYVVFYREGTSGSWSERDARLVYSQSLTGLISGKSYSVKVAGYTKMGRGTRSSSTSVVVGGIVYFHAISSLTNKDTYCLRARYQFSR